MVARRVDRETGNQGRTVRVSGEVFDQLAAISAEQQSTIGEVVADLVRERSRQEFYERMRTGYRELREDQAAWDAYQAEITAWDASLSEALEEY